MVAMIIPYCQHYIRYYFIKVMDWDVYAALATSISYFMCFLLFCGFLCIKAN
jgi:hypothetical protein